jgi:hypothetical protein
MPVIDVQVHPFDRNHPGRPWASPSHGLDSATGEAMVAAMTRVGVDGAILWTRAIGMLTYEQGVAPFRETTRLSESDKAALMGGTLQNVYKW